MKSRMVIVCLLCVAALVPVACQRQPAAGTRSPLDAAQFYVEPTAAAAPTPAASSNRTVVEFWTDDNEPARVAVYEEIARRFMERHPNIDLRIVPVDESSLSARVATAIEADALPDIVRLGVERLALFVADDLLDFAAAQNVIEAVGADDFRAGPLKMVIDPDTGQPMAVPYDGWIQALWYRTDVFEDLGLSPPTDWEAVRTAARTLQRTGRVEFGLVLPTDPSQNYVHQVFEQVAISNDAWPFDAAGNVTMNTPEMIAALTWYTQLQEFAMPGPQHAGGAREAYQYGRAGMFFYSTYIMDDLVQGPESAGGARAAVADLAQKTGFAAVLRGPNGSATYGQLITLAILRDADPAAQDVAAFFLTEGYMDVLALAPFGKVPVLKSAVEAWKHSSDYFTYYSDATLEQIANGYDTMQRWFSRPDYDAKQRAVIGEIEARLLIPQAIYEIAVDRTLTPRAAAERLQAEVEALLVVRTPQQHPH